jgi:hypothetical protein
MSISKPFGRDKSKRSAQTYTIGLVLEELKCAQMLIRDQDRTIDTISGTLNTIAQQAGLMGREITEHNECV